MQHSVPETVCGKKKVFEKHAEKKNIMLDLTRASKKRKRKNLPVATMHLFGISPELLPSRLNWLNRHEHFCNKWHKELLIYLCQQIIYISQDPVLKKLMNSW